MKNIMLTLAVLATALLSLPSFALMHVEPSDLSTMITPGDTITITKDINIKPGVTETLLGKSNVCICYLKVLPALIDRVIKKGKLLTINSVTNAGNWDYYYWKDYSFVTTFDHNTIRSIVCTGDHADKMEVRDFTGAIGDSAALNLKAPVEIE